MGEFNFFMKKWEFFLKGVPGAKARQLNHHTIPLLNDNTYVAQPDTCQYKRFT